jgi:hypothetical protein
VSTRLVSTFPAGLISLVVVLIHLTLKDQQQPIFQVDTGPQSGVLFKNSILHRPVFRVRLLEPCMKQDALVLDNHLLCLAIIRVVAVTLVDIAPPLTNFHFHLAVATPLTLVNLRTVGVKPLEQVPRHQDMLQGEGTPTVIR